MGRNTRNCNREKNNWDICLVSNIYDATVLYSVRGLERSELGGSHGCPGHIWDHEFLFNKLVIMRIPRYFLLLFDGRLNHPFMKYSGSKCKTSEGKTGVCDYFENWRKNGGTGSLTANATHFAGHGPYTPQEMNMLLTYSKQKRGGIVSRRSK